MTVIIDAGTQKMITIDHDRKEAVVVDMRTITRDLAKIERSDVKATITPTSQKRQIAGASGAADYAAFYMAAAEKGLFFTDPRAAKAQPGQARGMTELYRKMAQAGMAYATELTFKFEGSGMMAQMMNKMGGMTMTSEVTEVSGAALADSIFEVPAGYKTKTQ